MTDSYGGTNKPVIHVKSSAMVSFDDCYIADSTRYNNTAALVEFDKFIKEFDFLTKPVRTGLVSSLGYVDIQR